MREDQLYKEFKRYFLEALALLANESEGGKNMPITIQESIEFQGVGSYSFGYEQKNDYGRFVRKKWDLLKELGSYKSCLKYLTDKGYSKFYPEEQGFLLNTLVDFLSETERFELEDKKFEEIYLAVEEYIYSELIKFSCSAQLYGFKTEVDEVIIDKDIQIKKYTEIECKKIWRGNHFFSNRSNFPTSPNDFKVEVIFYKKKGVFSAGGSEEKEAVDTIKNILTVLRLFKNYNLRIGQIDISAKQWGPFMSSHIIGEHQGMGLGNYSFNISEQSELLKLWDNFKKMNLSKVYSLEIALKRFNFIHERADLEDKLIDIMIGFETLFSESTTEIRYKTSIRTSLLIGKDLDERRRIFKIMQVAYDLRSCLVHGKKLDSTVRISKPVDKELPVGEFVEIIKGYLSESIKNFIVLSTDNGHEEILDKLHESSLALGIK